MSAAQAYQASTGYPSSSSPAPSVVFPTRAPGHSLEDPANDSRRPPPQPSTLGRRPTNGTTAERGASVTDDYISSMGRMSFESQKSGPLDSVVNIPKIGDFSDFGSFEPDFSGESMSNHFTEKCVPAMAKISAPSSSLLPYQSSGHQPRQPSLSSMTSVGTHRRQASDASFSASGLTMTSGQPKQYMA